ncbi:MAG TPA: hypothetical protein VK789_28410 [Bryobacteraceae bacterium]|jgi:hypothetical protein|nr:hypothetical protein [Bryobacteraceae bacterium]
MSKRPSASGPGRYKLIGQTPVPCPDLMEWAEFMEMGGRQVAETFIDRYRVSTIFLGLDHRFPPDRGEPILFETMVFLNSAESQRRPEESVDEWLFRRKALSDAEPLPMECESRCSTWLEAEADHEAVCLMVEMATGSPRRGINPFGAVVLTDQEPSPELKRDILTVIRGVRRMKVPKNGKK